MEGRGRKGRLGGRNGREGVGKCPILRFHLGGTSFFYPALLASACHFCQIFVFSHLKDWTSLLR